MKIKYNNKAMWIIFKSNFLDKELSITQISEKIGVHKGTIDRWIQKEEVPPQYFNDINRLVGNKYVLDVDEDEMYKVMDQYFTPEEEAKKLITKTITFINNNWEIDLDKYTFIEPSAGAGAFYNNIPKKYKKIGIDVNPQIKQITKQDWFDYETNNKYNITIGNPPFGLRGQLALRFINKASEFSDFICFVLPPLFNSNGKGSPMLRVNKDFYLAKEMVIGDNNFNYPSGKKVQINSIYQIWTRLKTPKITPKTTQTKKSKWIDVISLSNGNTPSSKRNVKMIDKCDHYLPSTTFNKVEQYKTFNELPHNRGYGIIIKNNKKQLKNIIVGIDWDEVAFKSTNGANNLRIQLIIDAIEKQLDKTINKN